MKLTNYSRIISTFILVAVVLFGIAIRCQYISKAKNEIATSATIERSHPGNTVNSENSRSKKNKKPIYIATSAALEIKANVGVCENISQLLVQQLNTQREMVARMTTPPLMLTKRLLVLMLNSFKEEPYITASYGSEANGYSCKGACFNELIEIARLLGTYRLHLNEAPPRK